MWAGPVSQLVQQGQAQLCQPAQDEAHGSVPELPGYLRTQVEHPREQQQHEHVERVADVSQPAGSGA